MIEYILNYLGDNGILASSSEEQRLIENGIRQYLRENGIEEEDSAEYYKNYIKNHINKISKNKLKTYFIHYDIISSIHQIIFEFNDGGITLDRKQDLYSFMGLIYNFGLEEYIPIYEVKQILGANS